MISDLDITLIIKRFIHVRKIRCYFGKSNENMNICNVCKSSQWKKFPKIN